MPRARKRVGSGVKIDYQDWLYFRSLVDELRWKHSWREISIAAGKEEGWAHAGYQHRSIVSERDIRTVEGLAEAQRVTFGHPPEATDTKATEVEVADTTARLTPEQQRRVCEIMDIMRDQFGFRWEDVATAFGFAQGPAATTAYRRGGATSPERLAQAESVLADLMRGTDTSEPVADPPAASGVAEAASRIAQDTFERAAGATVVTTAEVAQAARSADPFAWMDRVVDGLLTIAGDIEAAAGEAPAMFRAPYTEAAAKVMALAQEFQR